MTTQLLLNLLILTTCIVYIWDWTNAPNLMASYIASWLTKGRVTNVSLKKPLGCSACMTFWITLIVLLIITPELVWMSLVYSFLTKYILYLILMIDALLERLFMLIEKLIKLL